MFQEEAMLEEAGVYASDDEELTEEQTVIREKAGLIRKEKAIIRSKHRLNKHRLTFCFLYKLYIFNLIQDVENVDIIKSFSLY